MPIMIACRICLAVNVRLLKINSSLQLVFEDLTKNALYTDVGKPILACYICYAQLKKCYKLLLISNKTEHILNSILEANLKITDKSIVLIDRQTNKLGGFLSVSQTECFETVRVPVKIKIEDADVSTEVESEKAVEHSASPPQHHTETELVIKEEKMEDMHQSENMASPQNTECDSDNGDVDTISQTQCGDGSQPEEVNVLIEDPVPTQQSKTEEPKRSEETSYKQPELLNTKLNPVGEGPHECQVCKRRFKRAAGMVNHYKIHIDDKRYECDICQYRFNAKQLLIRHFRTHTGEKPFECDVCQRRFALKSTLALHLGTHTGVKPFPCQLCDKGFSKRNCLLKHLKKHADKPFRCVICHERFYNFSDLQSHFKSHMGERNYECDYCHGRFTSKAGVRVHIYTHINRKTHKCGLCQSKFSTKRALIDHTRIHTGEKPYECQVCKRSFHRKQNYKEHLLVHNGEKRFECQVCKRRYSRKHAYLVHLRSHTGEKPYKCDYCQQEYSKKLCLKQHLRTHAVSQQLRNPFTCHVCSRVFTSKHSLKKHMESHVDNNPYKCDVCERYFNRKAHFLSHIRVHTGEKPFECGVCKNRFREKSHLTRHMVIHTAEKPFQCFVCPIRFNEKSNLDRHLRTHTNVRRYTCDVCKTKFNKHDNLLRHLKTHTGEKPYECDVCQHRFTQNAHLTRHKKTHKIFCLRARIKFKFLFSTKTNNFKVQSSHNTKMDYCTESSLKMLCCTCLSTDRKLFKLCRIVEGVNNLYSLLSYDAEAYKEGFYQDTASLHICWECKAMLSKISRFRRQACSVQKQLTDIADGRTNVCDIKTCLSKLKTIIKEGYDISISDCNDETDNFIDCGPASVRTDDEDNVPLSELHHRGDDDQVPSGNSEKTPTVKVRMRKRKVIGPFRFSRYFTSTEMSSEEMHKSRNARTVLIKDVLHKCDSCVEVFKTDIALQKHIEDYHTMKDNHSQCPVCHSFSPQDKLNSHMKSHFIQYTCKMCGESVASVECATEHMREHDVFRKKPARKPISKLDRVDKSTPCGFKCTECDKSFDNKSKRWKHIQTQHREWFACEHCGKRFAFRHNLQRHLRLHDDPPPREKCDVCHKLIRCDLLKVHARIHTARETCVCRACDKTFISRASYEHHLKYTRAHAQIDILKHKCPTCGKGYRSRRELKDHIDYQHRGLAGYHCVECGKALATRRCVTRHVRRAHRGLKENAKDKVCQRCGKAFRDKKGLREHELIHTGERPLPCAQCGRAFRQRAALSAHVRRLHALT
nr:zinc finger protein 91-like [Plodia interpunctella]